MVLQPHKRYRRNLNEALFGGPLFALMDIPDNPGLVILDAWPFGKVNRRLFKGIIRPSNDLWFQFSVST